MSCVEGWTSTVSQRSHCGGLNSACSHTPHTPLPLSTYRGSPSRVPPTSAGAGHSLYIFLWVGNTNMLNKPDAVAGDSLLKGNCAADSFFFWVCVHNPSERAKTECIIHFLSGPETESPPRLNYTESPLLSFQSNCSFFPNSKNSLHQIFCRC